ncbi:MAG: CcmD family protein [Candidatus Binatia bacterium]
MGHWEFVFLAYGIVWSAVLLYLVLLKRRLRKAEAERALYRRPGPSEDNA